MEWYEYYNMSFYLTTAITLVISIINIVVEVSIQLGSELTRPINITKTIIDTIKGISWI